MKIQKHTILASIGSGLEYYDFTIYALLISYISSHFFPSEDKFVSLISSYLVFAIAYIVRPLGGIIFGVLGDRYGRKIVLVNVMFLMAIVTMLMGLLPTYQNPFGGIFASITFVLCRLFQGLLFGAELPCALTFISEHTGKNYKGLNCAIMTSMVTLGVLSGNILIYILSSVLNNDSMQSWGWRIPFILGGLLALCAFFLRRNTEETPSFAAIKTIKPKFQASVFIRGFLSGFGILLLPSVLILFYLILPSIFITVNNCKPSEVFMASLSGYFISALLVPVFGLLGDKLGRRNIYLIAVALIPILIYPAMKYQNMNSLSELIIFMILYQLVISVMAGSYYPMLAESFPTNMRYTGVAASYNLSMLIASFFPILAAVVMKQGHNLRIIYFAIFILSIIAFVSAIISRREIDQEEKM